MPNIANIRSMHNYDAMDYRGKRKRKSATQAHRRALRRLLRTLDPFADE